MVVLASQTGFSAPKEAQKQRGRVLCTQKGTAKRSDISSTLQRLDRSLTQRGVLFLKMPNKQHPHHCDQMGWWSASFHIHVNAIL